MPTYEFRCEAGHTFDRFLKMSEAPLELACAQCGKPATRQMSGGAGLVFKGSGFYLTDYGRAGQKPSSGEGEGAVATAGESKSGDSKSGESKSGDSKSGESRVSDSKGGDSKSSKESAASASATTASTAKSDKSSSTKSPKTSE
ncbi:MAG: zinc ribbon domain-containing protein [Gemmatimonadaceae bacterium]